MPDARPLTPALPPLELVPQFDTLILFRPRDVPHGVSRVTAAHGKARFTVTA